MTHSPLRKAIEGTWVLKTFEIRTECVSRPWRPGAHGILIYSPDGYMSVSINSQPGGEAWMDSLLFYAGTYAVDDGVITHSVENATSVERLGKPMTRSARLINAELVLTAEGAFGSAVLVWIRPVDERV